MAGKYLPLEKYFSNLPGSTSEVTLSFEEIERILGSQLPQSAYEDQRWWLHEKDANHINTRPWANAGWQVASVDNLRKLAKFQRV